MANSLDQTMQSRCQQRWNSMPRPRLYSPFVPHRKKNIYIYIYIYIYTYYRYKKKGCLSWYHTSSISYSVSSPRDAQGHLRPGEVDIVPRRFFAAGQLGHGAQGETAIVDPRHGLDLGLGNGLSWAGMISDIIQYSHMGWSIMISIVGWDLKRLRDDMTVMLKNPKCS